MLFGLSKEWLRRNERDQGAKKKKKKRMAPCGAFMGSPTPALLVFFQ